MTQKLVAINEPDAQPPDADLSEIPFTLREPGRNLLLGVVAVLSVSAGFWVAITLTITHFLH
ncbi:MAG: hypothetical protein ABSE92_03220 [Terriglobales bacterium]|jgi:hypothetical protein